MKIYRISQFKPDFADGFFGRAYRGRTGSISYRFLEYQRGQTLKNKVDNAEYIVRGDLVEPHPEYKECLCWHSGFKKECCPRHKEVA